MGEAALATGIVGRTGVDQRVVAEDRRLRPLADNQGETVGSTFTVVFFSKPARYCARLPESCARAATPAAKPNASVMATRRLIRTKKPPATESG